MFWNLWFFDVIFLLTLYLFYLIIEVFIDVYLSYFSLTLYLLYLNIEVFIDVYLSYFSQRKKRKTPLLYLSK